MRDKVQLEKHRPPRLRHQPGGRPPFECIALLLQGGGALGAYQAGVYEALVEARLHPDWVAGISIGAVNSALIAGNPPEARLEKLRKFWDLVSTTPLWVGGEQLPTDAKMGPMGDLMAHATDAAAMFGAVGMALISDEPVQTHADTLRAFWGGIASSACSTSLTDFARVAAQGDAARGLISQMSAVLASTHGAPGFFAPRVPIPWLQPAGSREATSYYDSAPLKATLERLVDFDRINTGETRISVGAVNVRTGNFVYFDN